MGKTYILGNNENHARQLECEFIEAPALTNDYEIHNWLIPIIRQKEIEKLVIEITNNPILSMKIGLHVRLSINELKERSLIPIFFLSTSTLNTLILNTGIWSHIISTTGVYFSSFDNIENIKIELSVIHGISLNEYKSGFLDRIKILPEEAVGKHSLANIWGAYSMDKAARTDVLRANPDFIKRSAELYFKYVSAFNNLKLFSIKSVGYMNITPPDTINASKRKILLIDDEANKGWESVLRKVFKTSSDNDFVVIKEKVKDYCNFSLESKSLIENTSFDLYLIDLRLNGLEEEGTLNPGEFSGMKIMQKIKSLNQGNQVIVFSASNKVWNLKALLEAGADGYYMKESPEFGFSPDFSTQNYLRFKEEVQGCFEKDFLKSIFLDIQNIKLHLKTISDDEFRSELLNQIDLFWNMLIRTKSKTDFAYSYVTLYSIIEITNNHFFQQLPDNKWEIKDCGIFLDWQWDQVQNKYVTNHQKFIGNNPPEWLKIAGLYFQKWGQADDQFIIEVYRLIQKRNGFIHGDKSILQKQDIKGQYLNQDIFAKEGTLKLLSVIKQIIQHIKS